ncbi:MAG: peptidoglycan DL-endopeptidase CwlO, partial [Gaiellaceae bacterium]|nr:peptidoglycan DL-endopeptidase CwlO [Gaiellaceae bacterium]
AAGIVAAFLAIAAPSANATLPNWAKPQIATVVSHGLMATSVTTFHPNASLTLQTLTDLGTGLQEQLGPLPATPSDTTTGTTDTTGTTTVVDPTTPATMANLDRQLVMSLGLRQQAWQFRHALRAVDLTAPRRFGMEVVARLLGLRINHPAEQDNLELRPQDIATRAEAAYSAAQILSFGHIANSWQIAEIKQLAATISLPTLSIWQQRILNVAISKIGMPYVWGGTSDGPEAPFGVQARGGYDCSGFVWRVYKLQRYADEGNLASRIQGRTTYQMSVEVPQTQRITFAKLQPADVIFFGAHGPQSTGGEIIHTGIYVGGGWFIHSSGQGVALAQLTGWYRTEFAWGRRPLREAGLESTPSTATGPVHRTATGTAHAV